MLSDEGNAGERWKTTMGLISKKATLHVHHTFLYISLQLFCTTTTWNLLKLLSHTFYWGNVVRFLVHFFLTAAHFHLALVTAGISHFVNAAFVGRKFQQKKCLFSVSLALDLCRPISRWASLACRLLSLFLCLSLALQGVSKVLSDCKLCKFCAKHLMLL